ncbi:hypothetical protein L210DRAFT_3485540 [Boletus edulis BED1]|uniref:Uncharacterized protein n=1 Tax=Boletus edulis BED1 TaxID=1328754 RepID=A0AAD4BLX0_BOLED|nr:hypothetical protein L210DRAFT_3485540 [Boletus edulis BED1]
MSAPLEEFFDEFANLNIGFTYREDSTAHDNFGRLRNVLNSAQISVVRAEFNDALVQQFNFIYGTDSDLGAWQNLCSVIGITPVPDEIKDCKRLVWDANVNIVDLLESGRTGEPVQTFPTLDELREYSVNSRKIFPKQSAYAGGLLKELLREFFHPYFGNRRNGSAKRKRRKARKQAAAAAQSS